MTLRFLQTIASSHPEYPFQAGQIIRTEKLTAEMKRWVKEGRAVVVPESSEAAVVEEPERAVVGDVERHRV